MKMFEFKKDRRLIDTVVALFFLLCCHWIQFVRSGYMTQPLIRAICSSTAFVLTFIWGRKLWNPILFVWAMSILYFNRFHNYTSFVMILVSIWLCPKTKFFYLLVYTIGAFICMYLYKDTYTHCIIHFIGCTFFYLIFSYLYQMQSKIFQPLDLTEDEKLILTELAEGKQQKEITFCSHVTVSKKLAEARSRNGCTTTGELLTRFKATNHINK